MSDESETARIARLRNAASYQGYKNSLIEWTISDSWERIPGFMHVRGECVERYISSKTSARICKIVANGMISGEITCKF